ncbi:biosynthetic peptidoglycan transglycosylase [Peribacillus frigoritolerans]|uniref:transglycosylase domain-containing protein n=1 Tax=Peribacillus frigoritolerans TaxID=450367 RepID=UPI00345CB785
MPLFNRTRRQYHYPATGQDLSHDRTYNRKLSELIYAYQIERKKSKPEIMELYLNAIYFSNGAYGIEAASHYYFSKPTGELTKAELAFLAAIPNNPEYYNPLNISMRRKSVRRDYWNKWLPMVL